MIDYVKKQWRLYKRSRATAEYLHRRDLLAAKYTSQYGVQMQVEIVDKYRAECAVLYQELVAKYD